MSRIDEALRRLAEDRGVTPPNQARVQEAERTAEQWNLQQYPTEHAGATRRAERPVAPVVPIERALASAATVPLAQVPPVSDAVGLGETASTRLVVSNGATHLLVEQFRRLAAVLDEAQHARGLKVVAVTSSVPREGKTLVAANLALTLSESYGRRVLLVDADLRRPAVHSILGVADNGGLSEALHSTRRDVRTTRVTPHLNVLTAGRTDDNPLATLSSERMRELLEACASEYDWVIVDTPPVGVLSDAQIVARLSGAVLFVIGAEMTPFAVVERAISEIGRDCIIGTVLNRADEGSIPATSYYGDYYEGGERGGSRRG